MAFFNRSSVENNFNLSIETPSSARRWIFFVELLSGDFGRWELPYDRRWRILQVVSGDSIQLAFGDCLQNPYGGPLCSPVETAFNSSVETIQLVGAESFQLVFGDSLQHPYGGPFCSLVKNRSARQWRFFVQVISGGFFRSSVDNFFRSSVETFFQVVGGHFSVHLGRLPSAPMWKL